MADVLLWRLWIYYSYSDDSPIGHNTMARCAGSTGSNVQGCKSVSYPHGKARPGHTAQDRGGWRLKESPGRRPRNSRFWKAVGGGWHSSCSHLHPRRSASMTALTVTRCAQCSINQPTLCVACVLGASPGSAECGRCVGQPEGRLGDPVKLSLLCDPMLGYRTGLYEPTT